MKQREPHPLPLIRAWVRTITGADTNISFEQWLQENPPPDLQALIKRWGGYGSIPNEAWKEFDRRRARWEQERKA